MKRLLLSLALLASACFLRAADQPIGGSWLGLNNADASLQIADNEAQDLLNVDITENGYGIKKRAGYSQFRTVGNSTHGVRGGYYFRDVSGNDTLVHCNELDCSESVNGGAYSAFYTTATSGAYFDFVDSKGYLWIASDQRDAIERYDGSTLVTYASHPQGDQIEATPERLIISGTSANPNRIAYSKLADFTDFTTGNNEEDGWTDDIGLPGNAVTAIKYALGLVFVWTRSTLSVGYGSNQFDFAYEDRSTTVGTKQPQSVVYDQGLVYWQGQDRHFYRTDGNAIEKISRKLDVSNFRGKDENSWTLDSESDFEAGTVNTGVSTSYSPGSVTLSSGTLVDNFSDGDFTSSVAWSTFTSASASNGYVWSVSNGQFLATSTASAGTTVTGGAYTAVDKTVYSTGSWTFNFTFPEGYTSDFDHRMVFEICSATPTDASTLDSFCYAAAFLAPRASVTPTISIKRGGTTLATLSNENATHDGATHKIEFSRSAEGLLTISVDDEYKVSATDTNISSISYIAFGGTKSAADSTLGTILKFDDLYFWPNSRAYVSPVLNIGSTPSGWGTFNVNQSLSGGTIAYSFYSCASATCDQTTFTSSQTITNGSIPSVGVNQYAAWSSTYTRSVSTQSPSTDRATLNWYETGSGIPVFGSVDKDHRVMWSLAEGTSTVPNATYIYDPRFDTWLKYSVPFQAVAKVGETFYFGGVSTGVVYQWASGNTDDGSAITAYWQSKNFVSGDPFTEKLFRSVSLVAKTQTGSNLDITPYVNTSAQTTRNISLTDSNGYSFVRNNEKLASGTFGTFFSLKFGNDDGDAPFEVYVLKYEYEPKPWRVMP